MKSVVFEDIKKIADKIQVKNKKEVIAISVENKKPSLFESKFGGTPYVPKGKKIPENKNGDQLRLLAQLNLEDSFNNNLLPKKGMLQIFLRADDLYGADFNDPTMQDDFRVIYYEDIDFTVNEEDIKKEIRSLEDEEEMFPIEGAYKIKFKEPVEEGISIDDYDFEKLFLEEYNKVFTENKIDNIYDLDEEIYNKFAEEYANDGHKIGGYPYFTQEDPRKYDSRDSFDTILLQIDSEFGTGVEIIWGDSGICNFFINSEDLKNCDFSRVLYNWDCC